MEIPAELRDLTPKGAASGGAVPSAAVAAKTRGQSADSPSGVSVVVEDPDGAPHYIAVVIRDVKVEASPDWLKQRVESVGGRSINNVVDATNYMLHGYGQPVHAFDLAKLANKTIIVRKAKAGETIVTLDGVTRRLEQWMTIIADGERATALAGVMGGKQSEVTDTTTDILLEVAYFNPRDVRKVRRALAMATDASYRFERGVDGGATGETAAIAAGLIVAVAGGKIESVLDVGAAPAAPKPVRLRPARVAQLLGVQVAEEEIERVLASVGFTVEPGANRAYSVTPPTWRHDVAHEVDLVEEIARLHGYEKLPDDLRPYRIGTVPDHPLHVAARRVRDTLVAAGLAEVRPMPFTKGKSADDPTLARVSNPLAEDEPYLRREILDTLARRAEFNLNQHEGNVRIFEIGSVFFPEAKGTLPREQLSIGALIMGQRRPAHFSEAKPPAFDAWDAKALAETVARAVYPRANIRMMSGEKGALWSVSSFEAATEPEVGPEQVDGSHDETWSILQTELGSVRVVALDAPVWASPAFGVEIMLGVMSSAQVAAPRTHDYVAAVEDPRPRFVHFTPLPTTPAAEFDLALVVRNDTPAAEVEQLIRSASGDLLERLELFDEFRGAGLPEGTRSLAWRLTFRHPERTLRDKEIDGRRSQLLKTLEKELGVVPRSA
jgi:phenylalanyl-tRNA synthetase beta chain